VTSDLRGARRHSREVALQVLFAMDLHAKKTGEQPTAQEAFDDVGSNFEMPESNRAFANELVCGVAEHLDALDNVLRDAAKNWRVERMAVVDRNVLRLSAFELAHTETPVEVVIDEAVRMAKRFGDDPSSGFVNGVLDAVARNLRGEAR